MIETVADLLSALRDREIALLDRQEIKHAPTIGDMYEGLTREMVERAVFKGHDLRVVEGFISNESGGMSKQIDCMVVQGAGRPIPYTSHYVYDIRQVLAVVEVKKKLFSADMIDAYQNLRSLLKAFQPKGAGRLFRHAYRGIVMTEPPTGDDAESLPYPLQQVYNTLLIESVLPARIALGYHGFASEYSLRNSFVEYLIAHGSNDSVRHEGFGPVSMPDLIIVDDKALVKLNGMPFSHPLRRSGEWPLYGSFSGNVMRYLLEILWTRISYRLALGSEMFGEDLTRESVSLLIDAMAYDTPFQGWGYTFFDLSPQDLAARPPDAEWEPVELSELQFRVLAEMYAGKQIAVATDADFRLRIASTGEDVNNFVLDLCQTGLVYVTSNGFLDFLTEEGVIALLQDGRFVAAENLSGRFERWLKKNRFSLSKSLLVRPFF